ncbi:MAG: hypothetical protein ACLFS1_10985 [Opitutales bacterium]
MARFLEMKYPRNFRCIVRIFSCVLLLGFVQCLLASDEVRKHASYVTESLRSGMLLNAKAALEKESSSIGVTVFNEAFFPFYTLFIDGHPDVSYEQFLSFKSAYGTELLLEDYEKNYASLREAYSNLESSNDVEMDASSFFVFPISNGNNNLSLVDLASAYALGLAIESQYPDLADKRRSVINQSRGNEDSSSVEQPTAEIPAVAPEVVEDMAEVLEQVTAPKPSTKEEPAEVTVAEPVEEPSVASTPEPSEEPNNQPSQWWLWLIGVLIAVGGIGLAVRRKS